MSEKENKDSSEDNVSPIEDSTAEESTSNPESDGGDADISEPISGRDSFLDSPKPFSLSASGIPGKGAAGVNPAPSRAENPCSINVQASALDRRGLHSGKLDVFRRFFNQNDMEFYTLSDNRNRHRAERQRHFSEGCRPGSERKSSEDNPLGHMQVLEPEPEPLLNQAGAIIGFSRPSQFQNLRSDNALSGFGRVDDLDHSLGSMDTVPIGEVYAGNFSPRPQSCVSSRGVSSGSSFPSFPSRPQTASDSYNPKISPLPDSASVVGARRMSPLSTDSDSLPPERPIRRRRFGVSQPISVPNKLEDRQKEESVFSERNVSKDSSIDSSERVSSEEDANYPELSHSVESDHCLPMPDLVQGVPEGLQQNADEILAGMVSGISVSEDAAQNPEPETEESESEQDPISVLSCSPPDASKNTDQPPNDA